MCKLQLRSSPAMRILTIACSVLHRMRGSGLGVALLERLMLDSSARTARCFCGAVRVNRELRDRLLAPCSSVSFLSLAKPFPPLPPMAALRGLFGVLGTATNPEGLEALMFGCSRPEVLRLSALSPQPTSAHLRLLESHAQGHLAGVPEAGARL